MTTKLNFGRDVQGYNAFAPAPATDLFSATLASASSSSVTVPSNFQYWIVSFSFQPGADVWVRYNGTASAPAGATFSATNSELLPGSRLLTAGTTISLFNNSTSAADIGIIMYGVS